MQKIITIIANVILLYVYKNNLTVGHADGWIYLLNVVTYDVFLISNFILYNFLEINQSLRLLMINLVLQNLIVFSLHPDEVPFYGIIISILLISIALLSKKFLEKIL